MAGRRWGKDTASLAELLAIVTACAASPRDPMLIPKVHAWIVAPIWAHTATPWRWLKAHVPPEIITRMNESSHTMELEGDIVIECRSAERHEDLVGAGLDVVLVLEAGSVSSDAWDIGLRPMLASPGRWGMAILSGTPRGRSNYFYRLFMQGQRGEPDVWSTQRPTWDSPLVPASEIESMRATMPTRTFSQEVAAEFVDGEGAVFRGISRCIAPARVPQGRVITGIDWGMRDDYTALVALDESLHVVGYERHRRMSYEQLIAKSVEFIQHHRSWAIVPEQNSIGDPLVEQLKNALGETAIRIVPFMMTAPSKRRVIDDLAVSVEGAKVSWPETFADLTNELEIFEYVESKTTNHVRFSAPNGAHDDSVIALALAHAGMQQVTMRLQRAAGVWVL